MQAHVNEKLLAYHCPKANFHLRSDSWTLRLVQNSRCFVLGASDYPMSSVTSISKWGV